MNAATEFLALFRGNPETLGLDLTSSGKPGPFRLRTDIGQDIEAAWRGLARGHLRGKLGIGVYPYWHGKVHWGCVDLDEGEDVTWEQATALRSVLLAFDIVSWIERSRSKGYHVWVLADSWVPAVAMRRTLVGMCDLAGVPDKEVNPKSEQLHDGQLGNFVRLPYYGIWQGGIERQVVVDPSTREPMPFGMFVVNATQSRTNPDRIMKAADQLYMPALQRKPGPVIDGPWTERLSLLAQLQYSRGPKADSDRSSYLYGFGRACAESGLSEDDVVVALRAADDRHCSKYTDRKDADTRYGDIARKAIDGLVEDNKSW